MHAKIEITDVTFTVDGKEPTPEQKAQLLAELKKHPPHLHEPHTPHGHTAPH